MPIHTQSDAKAARAVLRSYVVFNADQIDNLPAKYLAGEITAPPPCAGEAAKLGALFGRVPASVRHENRGAFYTPEQDYISMPPPTAFPDWRKYYATLAHELAHWTGHPTRLDRGIIGTRYGSAEYAREELVAELAAAFLGAELGLPCDHIEDHASYIDHWLKILDRDPGALMQAAGKAQAAADHISAYIRS